MFSFCLIWKTGSSFLSLLLLILWQAKIVVSIICSVLTMYNCTFQFINVYITKYDTGGLYWPTAHNAIIFSLLLTQTIVLGVFTHKNADCSSSFTIALIICTLLFHFYCMQRFFPLFQSPSAQVIGKFWKAIWLLKSALSI